ncbi:hypothetical protein PYS58_04350 [Chryseobacterium indologenes]|uniref:hypothetical protein n=1 Tax=Chryseobacterium indologenes TaxID=253 RepID=UPI0023E77605|nr:hypothetical protein [Chryseobacterium indologenes]WET50363.1 hypothetical protein PYS58_04350 [Chryseobacterium indologenes]
MKKKSIISGAMLFSVGINAQIGINTATPSTTLAIEAKEATGNASNVDGILIPRVDRQRAQSMTDIPLSTMVYIDDISTGTPTAATVNVDISGFYYFNGNVWEKLSKTATAPNSFVPHVVAAGQASNVFIISENTGFNTFSFTPTRNDGNWNTTDNTYTIPKKGYYQLSLQSFVGPSSNYNSFAWNIRYSNTLYEYKSMSNVQSGWYNGGGTIILYFNGDEVLEFGGIPCLNCNTGHYAIHQRSFTITYFGE